MLTTLALTISRTPYWLSTFARSCTKHCSMRSWKGRRSSVTFRPWIRIPSASSGVCGRTGMGLPGFVGLPRDRDAGHLGQQGSCPLQPLEGCCRLYLPGNEVLQLLDVPLVLRMLLQVGLLEKGLQRPPPSQSCCPLPPPPPPQAGTGAKQCQCLQSSALRVPVPDQAQHPCVLTVSYLAKPPMTAGSTMPLSSMESGLTGRLGSFWCRLISLIIFSFVFIMVSMAFSRGEMMVCAQGGREGQQPADPATCLVRSGRVVSPWPCRREAPGLHISPHTAPQTPGTSCLGLSQGLTAEALDVLVPGSEHRLLAGLVLEAREAAGQVMDMWQQ